MAANPEVERTLFDQELKEISEASNMDRQDSELWLPSVFGQCEFVAKGSFGVVVKCFSPPYPNNNCDDADDDDKGKIAIKKFTRLFRNQVDNRRWLCCIRELQLLFALDHPNVMSALDLLIPLKPTFIRFDHVKSASDYAEVLRDWSRSFSDVYVAMPYMQCTLKRTYIIENEPLEMCLVKPDVSGAPFGSFYRKFFLFQVTSGLAYLHGRHVQHRDLKPDNILVDRNCRVKICDFGQGRNVDVAASSSPVASYANNCTLHYAAPETLPVGDAMAFGHEASIFTDERNLHSVDSWSLGCIFAEMLLGRSLFKGSSEKELFKSIMHVLGPLSAEDAEAIRSLKSDRDGRHFLSEVASNNKDLQQATSQLRQTLEEDCFEQGCEDPETEIDLITKMLRYNPFHRISPREALESPFFDEVRGHDFFADIDPRMRSESPVTLVDPCSVQDAARAREFIWSMFLERHPVLASPSAVDAAIAAAADSARRRLAAAATGSIASPSTSAE